MTSLVLYIPQSDLSMFHSDSLPFIIKRGSDVFSGEGMTSTVETVHGLLRPENDELKIHWRLVRKTEHMGSEMRSDQEVEPVREIVVSLSRVAGAIVRRRWWLDWATGPRLVLTASDLGAFEELAGHDGLSLDHPAEVVLRLRRSDALAGREFGAELALAKAEYDLAAAERRGLVVSEVSVSAERCFSVTSRRQLIINARTLPAIQPS